MPEEQMKIEKTIKEAIRRASTDGITVWGAMLPRELDDMLEVAELKFSGCSDERCAHNSHDPGVNSERWTPCQGVELSKLGEDDYGEGWQVTWYRVAGESEEEFFCVESHRGGYWHDSLVFGDPPDWVLTGLVDDESVRLGEAMAGECPSGGGHA